MAAAAAAAAAVPAAPAPAAAAAATANVAPPHASGIVALRLSVKVSQGIWGCCLPRQVVQHIPSGEGRQRCCIGHHHVRPPDPWDAAVRPRQAVLCKGSVRKEAADGFGESKQLGTCMHGSPGSLSSAPSQLQLFHCSTQGGPPLTCSRQGWPGGSRYPPAPGNSV